MIGNPPRTHSKSRAAWRPQPPCKNLLAILLILVAAPITRADLTHVLARGQGERLWLVRTDTSETKNEKGEAKTVPTTSVRRLADPVKGTWLESFRLGGEAVDAAPLSDRLAVLSADGSWQLAWDGGSLPGPTPDSGHVLRRFASDGDILWAIGTKPGEAGDLLKWTESGGWKVVAPLPKEADLPDLSLGVYEGRPWLACGDAKSLRVSTFRPEGGGAWQQVAEASKFKPQHPNAWVSNATQPLLVLQNEAGRYELSAPNADKRSLVPQNSFVQPARAWTVFGSSVRLLAINKDHVEQTVIDNFGRGQTYGPDAVPDPAPPLNEQRLEWLNVALLMGLTIAMLRSLRSEEHQPPVLAGGWRIAPLWRRALAAAIDGLPFIAVGIWVVATFEGSPEALKLTPRTFFLPLYLALFAYVGHVTVSELLFGTSLGKWLLRLRVIGVEGERPSPGRIVLRNVLRVLEISLFLPMFMPLLTPNAQRVGDMAARTLVVARASQTPPPPSSNDPS